MDMRMAVIMAVVVIMTVVVIVAMTVLVPTGMIVFFSMRLCVGCTLVFEPEFWYCIPDYTS
jgi:hypothetical protein